MREQQMTYGTDRHVVSGEGNGAEKEQVLWQQTQPAINDENDDCRGRSIVQVVIELETQSVELAGGLIRLHGLLAA
jgi:hypothetical protein